LSTLPFSLPNFAVEYVTASETGLTIRACASSSTASCPSCRQVWKPSPQLLHPHASRLASERALGPVGPPRAAFPLHESRLPATNLCRTFAGGARFCQADNSFRNAVGLHRCSSQRASRLTTYRAISHASERRYPSPTSQKEGAAPTNAPNSWGGRFRVSPWAHLRDDPHRFRKPPAGGFIGRSQCGNVC